MIYYYSIASPQAIILSKIIYNVVLSVGARIDGLLAFFDLHRQSAARQRALHVDVVIKFVWIFGLPEFDFGNCIENEQQQYPDGGIKLSRHHCALADGNQN